MSNVMDRKVVEMQFDNAQFEKNVKTSMSTLDKLKASLKFDGIEKGFENIEKGSKKVEFSGMLDGISVVTTKFSALEQMAIGSLRRIGERAIDAGIKLAKSMSVDNISAGWGKFEEKTKSVGTLIAQGYDLATVNEQLERLNFFTDETSYSFTNMVEEIAKFTATGKGLEESVTALMGIANWAALSGQNASTANRAMYQLSQAMGSGVMRKEDYKSIQNVSMDTAEFRQRALDAAVTLKTLKKNADGTYQSIVKGAKSSKFNISQFADHLTNDAWFTSEVMMKVYTEYAYAVDEIQKYMADNEIETASQAIRELDKLARAMDDGPNKQMLQFGLKAFKAAQEARSWQDTVESVKEAVASGFMKTFEIIFGQYDEAVDLWTDLAERFYDAFATPINNFNDVLEESLKSSTPYIKEYFAKIAEGEGDIADKAVNFAKEFGYSSEETIGYIKGLAHGNDELANTVLNYIKLYKLAGDGDKVVGASTDKIIEQTAAMTGATEAQISELKKIGDEYGYSSSRFSSAMTKVFGKNKWGLYEMAHDMLAVADGIDIVEKKDLDSYLENTLKFTSDQVEELHKLADQYGATSTQVDDYIKSLQNFTNFGHGNRGWTKRAIVSLLEITNGIGTSELGHKTGDIVSYVSNLSGASEDSVKILWDLIQTETELANAAEKDTEAIADNAAEIEKWSLEIANGDEALQKQILDIMHMRKELDQLSGYRNILEAFNNVWDYLASILEVVGDAFESVFGSLDSGAIYDFTVRLKEATENLKLSDETAEKLKKTFEGFFSIFKLIGQVLRPLTIPIKAIFEELTGGNGTILDLTASTGEWLTNLERSGVVGEKLTKFFTGVAKVIRPLVRGLKEIFNFDRISSVFKKAGGGIAGVFAVISDSISIVIDKIFEMISELTGWDVDTVRDKVLGFFDRISQAITNFLPDQEKVTNGFDKIKSVAKEVFEYLGIGKKKDTSGIDDATGAVEDFSDAIDGTTSRLSTFVDKFRDFFGNFKGISDGITGFIDRLYDSGIFTGFGNMFEKIKTNIKDTNFVDFLGTAADVGKGGGLLMLGYGIKTIGDSLWKMAKAFKSNGIFGYNSVFKKDWSKTIRNFALAIALLAASFLMMSKIPEDRMDKIFWVITYLVVEMVGVLELINHTMTGKGTSSVLLVIGIALAIRMMAKAMISIATEIPEDRLGQVVLAMTALVLALDSIILVMGIVNGVTDGKGSLRGAVSVILMAVAIGIVARALVKISEDADPDTIDKASMAILRISWGLGVLMGAMALIGLASRKQPAIKIQGGLVGSILAFGIAMSLIVASISLLKGIGPSEIVAAATAIAIIAGAMTAAMMLLSVIKQPWKFTLIAKAFLVMSAALVLAVGGILLFLEVMRQVNEFTNDEFKEAAVRLLKIAGVIAVLGLALTVGSVGFIAFGIAAIEVAVALVLISTGLLATATAIEIFARTVDKYGVGFISAFEMILDGLIGLTGKIATLGINMVLDFFDGVLSSLPRIRKQLLSLLQFGLGIILDSISASIVPITETAITVLIGILDALIASGPELFDKVLTLVSILLTAVVDHAEEIGDQLAEAIYGFITGFLHGVAKQAPDYIDAAFELVRVVISAFAEALEQIGIEDIKDLIEMCNGLLIILGYLSVVSLLMPTASAGLVSLGALMVEFLVIFGAIAAIAKIPGINGFIGNGGKLINTMMEILNRIASKDVMASLLMVSLFTFIAPLAVSGIIAYSTFIAAMLPVLAAVSGLAQIPGFSDFIASGTELIDVIHAIFEKIADDEFLGVLAKLSLLTLLAPLAMAGIISYAACLAALTPVLLAFGGLSRIPGLTDLVGDGGQLLIQLGGILGEFLGAFVGGALEGLSASLPAIGENLSAFGESVGPFVDAMREVDSDVLSGASMMALVMAEFSAVAFLNAVTALIGGDIQWNSLGDKMELIGEAMTKFISSTEDVDSSRFKDLIKAAEGMVGLLAVFGVTAFLDTVLSLVSSPVSWMELGTKLAAIAGAMATFSKSTSGIDADNFVKVTTAAEKLTSMVTKIQAGEGVFKWLAESVIGKDDMGDFGKALGQFSMGIKEFGEKSKGLSGLENDIDAAISAADKALDFSKRLNGDGSLWDAIVTLVQDESFKNFGLALKDFIAGIKEFAEGCSEVVPYAADVEASKPVFDTVLEIFRDLVGDKSIIKAIAVGLGAGAMKEFGTNLSDFIGGVVLFSSRTPAVAAFKDSVEEAKPVFDTIIDIFQDLVGDKSIIKAIATGLGAGAMSEFGTNLEFFANGIMTFCSLTPGIAAFEDSVTRASSVISMIIDLFQDLVGEHSVLQAIGTGLGVGALEQFGNEIAAFGSSMKSFSDKVSGIDFGSARKAIDFTAELSAVHDSIANSSLPDEMNALSTRVIYSMITGFDDQRKKVQLAVDSVVDGAVTNVRKKEDDFYSVGVALGLALMKGLDDFSFAIENEPGFIERIKELFSELPSTLNSYASRFYTAGQLCLDGFIRGIKSKKSSVVSEVTNVGSSVVKSFENVLEIQSPSKAAYRDGKYFITGFVDAVSDYTDAAEYAAAGVGESALKGIKDSINAPSSGLLGDLDNSFTIRPVLDLSEIQNGITRADGLLGGLNGYSIDGSLKLGRSALDSMGGSERSGSGGEIEKLTKTVEKLGDKLDRPNQVNNFTFNGLTNDQIVREVKKSLTKDVIKEGRQWA